jgi:tetratricopeptide (TPR) repeat protein
MEKLRPFFEQGGTWQILLKMGDDTLETQYLVGQELLDKKQLQEATATFTSLTVLNPYRAKYWSALADAYYRSRSVVEALQAYFLAQAIEPSSCAIGLRIARCYADLGEKQAAYEMAELVLEEAVEADLRSEIKTFMQEIKR